MRLEPSSIRKIELWFAGVLTGLIAFLQIYRASQVGPLWRDEIASLGVATMPSLGELWASLPHECCSVLPYLLLRFWTGLPALGGEAGLRILSAVVTLGILPALWFHRKALGYNAPLFSLILFGLNPNVVVWLAPIRGYTLGVLFLLLAWGLIWKVAQSPSKSRVSLAAMASVLSVQCLYQNAFFLFAICLGASFVCVRKQRWNHLPAVLGVGAVAAASLLPYLPIIQEARELLVVAEGPDTWAYLMQRLYETVTADSQLLLWTWIICVGLCVLIGGFLWTYKPGDPEREEISDRSLFNLTVLVVGITLFLGFLKSTHLHTNPWYYLILMAAVAVSLDVGLEPAANAAGTRLARLAAVGVLAAVMFPFAWTLAPARYTNVDLIAAAMEEHAAEDDLIILNPYWFGISFQHYYQGKTKWVAIPPIDDLTINRFDLLKDQMTTLNPLTDLWVEIEQKLRAGKRVWVIGQLLYPKGELPYFFPPAPNGPAGWHLDAYLVSWSAQLGYFLREHSVQSGVVPLSAMNGIQFIPGVEVPVVQISQGWR